MDDNDGRSRETGLGAWNVPVVGPDGVDHVLRFQWMRIHPATAIAVSSSADTDNDDSSEPAVQASRMMKHYQQALGDNNHETSIGKANMELGETRVPKSPFLRANGVHVDLCELFDPPLLSEAFFASSVSALNKKDGDHDSGSSCFGRTSTATAAGNGGNMQLWFMRMLHKAFREFGASEASSKEPSQGDDNRILGLTDTPRMSTMTREDVRLALPVNWVANRIQERVPEPTQGIEFSLCVMTVMAEHSAAEAMGRYILSDLANKMLSPSPTQALTSAVSLCTRRLAKSLLATCSLANLDKSTLHSLLWPAVGVDDSELLCELRHCMAEQY